MIRFDSIRANDEVGIYPLSDNSDGVVASELPEIRGLIPGSCPFSTEQKSQREPNPCLVSSRTDSFPSRRTVHCAMCGMRWDAMRRNAMRTKRAVALAAARTMCSDGTERIGSDWNGTLSGKRQLRAAALERGGFDTIRCDYCTVRRAKMNPQERQMTRSETP